MEEPVYGLGWLIDQFEIQCLLLLLFRQYGATWARSTWVELVLNLTKSVVEKVVDRANHGMNRHDKYLSSGLGFQMVFFHLRKSGDKSQPIDWLMCWRYPADTLVNVSSRRASQIFSFWGSWVDVVNFNHCTFLEKLHKQPRKIYEQTTWNGIKKTIKRKKKKKKKKRKLADLSDLFTE